jgi:hypothetical protein
VPPKDFSELSDEEAEAYFASYTAAVPDRVARLRREVGEEALDLSPESLVPAWEWFLGRREAEPAQDGHVLGWYEPDPPELAAERLAPGVLSDIDLIAAYFASVLLENVSGAEWAIGRLPKRMEYEAQNKPLVQLPEAGEADPVGVVYSLAVRVVLLGGERDPNALRAAYDAWVAS